jgi:hypothetical protein
MLSLLMGTSSCSWVTAEWVTVRASVTAEVWESDGYIVATHGGIAVWVTAKVMKSVGHVVAT